jgi:signal transduction histidine kinase
LITRKKLAHEILKSVAVRVTLVVIISSALSYSHIHGIIRHGISSTLEKYVSERSHSESFLFDLAIRNQDILKKEVQSRLKTEVTAAELLKFDERVGLWPDGTTRNRKESFDGTKMASVFIPAKVALTPELKHRIVVLIDLAESYGHAFRSHFQDTYFIGSDDTLVAFWPEVPTFAIDLATDYRLTKDEYFYVADAEHNPARKTAWTALYYDKNAKLWMASAETPVDDAAGRQLLTIGHDIMLLDMIQRTSQEHLQGTYNIVFRGDGRLVVHPEKIAALQAADGVYDINKGDDQFLKNLYQAVIAAHGVDKVIEHPTTGDLVAYHAIDGPNWYFATVYPKAMLQTTALNAIVFVLALGVLSLLGELYFLYRVVQREVHEPLQQLSQAAEAITVGNFSVPVRLQRQDELGQFADTFRAMASAISERDVKLKEHSDDLEKTVSERTAQLDVQRSAAMQNSKMASLGEMAGGIAHEINNPLTIIKGTASFLRRAAAEEHPDQEKISAYVKTIDTTVDRIYRIVKGLLVFARLGDNDPYELAEISDIINETVALASAKLKLKAIEIRIPPAHNLSVSCECRRVEISQVLLNLISNAADAIADLPEPRWIEFQTRPVETTNLEIRVIDCGMGLKKEVADKIFQPFYTTKEIGKGTGLGLSISKGIIEKHGGKILVDSSADNTCFVILLPKNQLLKVA